MLPKVLRQLPDVVVRPFSHLWKVMAIRVIPIDYEKVTVVPIFVRGQKVIQPEISYDPMTLNSIKYPASVERRAENIFVAHFSISL